jgi:hypothetical protein
LSSADVYILKRILLFLSIPVNTSGCIYQQMILKTMFPVCNLHSLRTALMPAERVALQGQLLKPLPHVV